MADIVIKVGKPNYTLTIRKPRYAISLSRGTQGPPGATGPAGGTAVAFPAGENLSAARVVIISGGSAYHFQPGNAAHQGRAYGITTAAATTGADAAIQISGQIEHAAFTFAADQILYVFNNGVIVDTDPELAVMQIAGVSSGSNKMRIDFSISVKKA